MNTLKGLVGNLVILRYLVLTERINKRCDVEQLLDSIDELLEKPKNFPIKEIEVFQGYVTEYIYTVERLQERKQQSPDQKQEIDFLIKRLYKIRERCRQLKELEQLILRIMLTVKLYR